MAFQNSNFGQAAQQGDKQKTNFPVGRINGSDARMDISIWKSTSGIFTIFMIKQAVGKDPSSGMNVYENKSPSELPRVFFHTDSIRALQTALDNADPNNININIQQNGSKNSSRMIISGAANGQVKITLETSNNGNRTITLDAIPCGAINVNAAWLNLKEFVKIASKKALLSKMDPAEFGSAIGSSEESSSSEELPI